MKEDELAALITSLHRTAQRALPVVLVGAGFPQLRGRMGRAKSYAERLFDFPEIGPLSPEDAQLAIEKPERAEGVDITADALTKIVEHTRGYADLVHALFDHLEVDRGNAARSRNTRLAVIHSFLRYVALTEPTHAGVIQRVLALPTKRCDHAVIEFLTRPEIDALLAAPDLGTWTGRRDRALLLVAVQTGLRVSELTGLRVEDVTFGRAPHVLCRGKGRKERCTPLRRQTAGVLRDWVHEQRARPDDPLLPSARGARLSTDGVAYTLAKHVETATRKCPSLSKKRVSPHVLRHSAAMDLLQHGVDRTVIALWLGHEDVRAFGPSPRFSYRGPLRPHPPERLPERVTVQGMKGSARPDDQQ